MRHFILTGHGRISEGIASSVELITGKKVAYFNAYVDGEDSFYEKIKEEISYYEKKDEIIIFTDLMGGSVNNEMMHLLCKGNVHLICGMNLSLVMGLLLSDENQKIQSVIEESIQDAKDNIRYCNELKIDKELDEF